MKIMSIAGARPNFMKLAAIARAIEEHNLQPSAEKAGERIVKILLQSERS